ncbi:hypothetical protein BT69DRAFT_1211279 [Atractiella rhizophila]|nr:hypothetical protein BT69DRAFT_1211279 [Atractiella rhizophila]
MSPPRTSDGNNEEGEEEWTTLDMGGNKIKQLSPTLFRYTFLTTLYLCHNNLTTLPSSIRELCNLTVLDISFNSITALPAELGMITSLRYLFVYDNQLTSLPAELGTLFQLDHLGIEGNHLPDNVMSLLDKDGTPGLIAYLRDSCAVPMPPPERLWFTTSNDTFALPQHAGDMDALNKSGQGDLFSILSYNILCEKMATTQMYGYTPSWALNWEYRKELILQEIITYSADIVCLQEVESAQYEEYFLPHLKQEYDGVYRQKSRVRHMTDKEKKRLDGSAIFFKSKNFRLIEGHLVEFNQVGRRGQRSEDMINRVMTKDDIAVIALLEHRTSGAKLIVSTFHLQWDPDFRDVKLIQTARLLEEIETLADRFARMPSSSEDAPTYSDGSKIPTILAGDFNSVADSGVFEFLKKGKVDPDHPDFLQKRYGHYTTDGLSHNLSLETAYGDHTHNIEFTNYTPGFKGVLDYIWYTTKTLTVTGLLQGLDPSYTSRVVGFPNAHFPSDHVSILSQMSFK